MELGWESLRQDRTTPCQQLTLQLSLIEGSRPPRSPLNQDLLSHYCATMQPQPPEVPGDRSSPSQGSRKCSTNGRLCVTMPSWAVLFPHAQPTGSAAHSSNVLYPHSSFPAADKLASSRKLLYQRSLPVSHCTGESGVQKEGDRNSSLQLSPFL